MLTQKNKFVTGDMIEIMKPDGRNIPTEVLEIRNGKGELMEAASHASEALLVRFSVSPEKYDVLRVCAEDSHKKD